MKTNVLGVIIASFIVIILGIVFLNQTANSIVPKTSLSTITDDLFTVSNTTCVRLSSTDCVYSITSIRNNSVIIGSGNYSICSSTNGVNDGVIFNNAPAAYDGDAMNATYVQNNACSYVDNSTARSLLGMITIFFALGIVAFALYYLYKTGILDFSN